MRGHPDRGKIFPQLIFLPNLLMADNQLKLARIYRHWKRQGEMYKAIERGRKILQQSLRSVKTEWAFQVEKEFEKELSRK